MDINLLLALFAGIVLAISLFSTPTDRVSLPAPLLTLAYGVLIGPYVLSLIHIDGFGVPSGLLLEEAARLTLAVSLAGVALRLPHGYWRKNLRWVTTIIGLGMILMLLVTTGILWLALGLPVILALLMGAILTPTDPVVTTPLVTGSMARERIPDTVRHDLSSESGINDGLGYLFVMLPVLLLTRPGQVWDELLTRVLLWGVLGAVAFGAAIGWLLGKLFAWVRDRGFVEKSSYVGFVLPLGLFVLGAGKLLGTDAVLAVFVAAAVFGQIIHQHDEDEQDKYGDAISRFLMLPVFVLIGVALPLEEWAKLGWVAPALILVAVLLRRLVAVWALRPLLKNVHTRAETAFISWFGPIGISALFYATLAERLTGNHEVFVLTTLAIVCSVVVHGLSTAPFSVWLARRETQRLAREQNAA